MATLLAESHRHGVMHISCMHKKPPLQGEQPIAPQRAPTLAATASRVREQEVFDCYFPQYSSKYFCGFIVLPVLWRAMTAGSRSR